MRSLIVFINGILLHWTKICNFAPLCSAVSNFIVMTLSVYSSNKLNVFCNKVLNVHKLFWCIFSVVLYKNFDPFFIKTKEHEFDADVSLTTRGRSQFTFIVIHIFLSTHLQDLYQFCTINVDDFSWFWTTHPHSIDCK